MCSGNKSKHVFNSRILLLLETRAQKQRKIRVGDKKTCYYWQNSVYTNCVHCSASQCQASLLTQYYSKQASAVTLCCFLFLQKIWLLEEETNALRRKIRAWNFVVTNSFFCPRSTFSKFSSSSLRFGFFDTQRQSAREKSDYVTQCSED